MNDLLPAKDTSRDCKETRSPHNLNQTTANLNQDQFYQPMSNNTGIYRFHMGRIKEVLRKAGTSEKQGIYLTLPGPVSNAVKFKIWKTESEFSETLYERFEGYDDHKPSTEILVKLQPSGINAVIASSSGTWFISAIDTRKNTYMVYWESELLSKGF